MDVIINTEISEYRVADEMFIANMLKRNVEFSSECSIRITRKPSPSYLNVSKLVTLNVHSQHLGKFEVIVGDDLSDE